MLAVREKNAPGRHDQTTHGNWAVGYETADLVENAYRLFKGNGPIPDTHLIANPGLDEVKDKKLTLGLYNLKSHGIIAASGDLSHFEMVDEIGELIAKAQPISDDTLSGKIAVEVEDSSVHYYVKTNLKGDIYLTFDAYFAGVLPSVEQQRGRDVFSDRAMKNIYEAMDYLVQIGYPKETPVVIHEPHRPLINTTLKSLSAISSQWHILPWWASRIYQIVARKELPIPAQQRRLSARTSAYEKRLKKLWEDGKAAIKAGKLTPQEFAAQMGDLGDSEFVEMMAEVLSVDIDELTPAHLEMATRHATENRGFIQSSLLPDIVKAVADPEADLGIFDYRIAALYGGALWKLGSLATVTFDGVSLRDLGDLFLFAGPKDDRTCQGERGCDQHVNQVYPVAYILGQNIIPGNFVCHHNCRHMLIPVASLPEEHRPPASVVHSDIQHVYGMESTTGQ